MLSNSCLDNSFVSSVLPTPVGQRNRNTPLGLSGSDMPALDLLIALLTAVTALSCPTTDSDSFFSKLSNFSFSDNIIDETGMPVHFDTTFATISSVTLLRRSFKSL